MYMAKRIGRDTLLTEHKPRILHTAAVVGQKEGGGPLGAYFDMVYHDTLLGQDSWEKAESTLQTEAVKKALKKAELPPEEVQYIFAGDLLNQCTGAVFGLRALEIPFLGQYGACSTMAQTLAMASLFVDSGLAERAVAVTSSHFCSAERQFRFPLEYGSLRAPTSQWTVTGAGSAVVGNGAEGPYVAAVTVGRIVDLGITDSNNMGAAMAPAAAATLTAYFNDTGTHPDQYDLIVTGDLGSVGSALLYDLMDREGFDIREAHADCGLLIFDRIRQKVNAGGSGCGCSASVLCGYLMHRLRHGELNNILFMATGALLSPTTSQQGETIPGIAHAVVLEEVQ
jgi:stage V sporulation protein AD